MNAKNIELILYQHPLYPDFLKIKQRLQSAQFVCWIAGGAVRDFLLGKASVEDFDLVTDAHTESLKKIFPEAVLVGEQFGVLKIPVASGAIFDLATFREESDYKDGRRPSHVFASTPLQDVLRRDFTINSLFWDDENKHIVDLTAGVFDLQNCLLKCVGNPRVRFEEDYLRLIRLVRFSVQLKMSIDSDTFQQAFELMERVQKISGERIWTELKKTFRYIEPIFLKSDIFIKMIREVFGGSFEVNTLLQKLTSVSLLENQSEWQLLIFITQLNIEVEALESLLKNRFKVSTTTFQRFRSLCWVLKKSPRFEFEELCYHVEKNKHFYETLTVLSRFEKSYLEILKKVNIVLQTYPQPLISGADLMSVIPSSQISEALMWLRKRQFAGDVFDKTEAIQMICQIFNKPRQATE